jgi:GT2 family glycosyltransferase
LEHTNGDPVSSSPGCLKDPRGETLNEETVQDRGALGVKTIEADPDDLREVKQQLVRTQMLLLQKEAWQAKVFGTFGWRLLNRFGPLKHGFLSRVRRAVKRVRLLRDKESDYREWVAWSERTRVSAEYAQSQIKSFEYRPRISILMPVFNPPAEYLTIAIDSVVRQFYADWELCICNDGSTSPRVREVLDEYASNDERIRVTVSPQNEGIALATNRALSLASGEFVGFLDHDDELTPNALFEVVAVLQHSKADLIYSDEDKLDSSGGRCQPFFKPCWSPDLLLSTMYTCHFSVYRKVILDEIGGLREGFDGSQDYDLALRFTEKTERIAHIPRVLYQWRQVAGSSASSVKAKPYAYAAGQKALTDAIRRRGIKGEVLPESVPGFYRVKRTVIKHGKVSIIIPTRDRLNLLRKCVTSIEFNNADDDIEILIVDNGSRDRGTLAYLASSRHRVIRDDEPFNFSRLNNLAAQESTSEYILFLNDDTEVIEKEWLSAMLEQAQRLEVGAVGAKLLYRNGKIQHAGVVLGLCGLAGHTQRHEDGLGAFGYMNFANIVRNYSAVTGACLMLRREVFNTVGGFDERLAVRFSDVDLCLRLRKLGFLVVYTPYARLYHREMISRGVVNKLEEDYFWGKWHDTIPIDPYYNPNLSLRTEDFSIDYSKPEAFYLMFAFDLFDHEVPVTAGCQLGQAFIATHNDLCAIGVRLVLHSPVYSGVFRLHVRESVDSEVDLRTAELAAWEISHKDFTIFRFDPICKSSGEQYYFFLEKCGDTGSIATIGKTTYTSDVIGPSFENHRATSGTLSYRIYGLANAR